MILDTTELVKNIISDCKNALTKNNLDEVLLIARNQVHSNNINPYYKEVVLIIINNIHAVCTNGNDTDEKQKVIDSIYELTIHDTCKKEIIQLIQEA